MKNMIIILALVSLLVLAGCTGPKKASKSGSLITGAATTDVSALQQLMNDADQGKKSCKDSDGGKNPNTRGSVSGVAEDVYEYTDFCADGTKFLIEYYCEGLSYKEKSIKCSGSCSSGRCV